MIIPNTAQKILDKSKIDLKLDRMAYEVLEKTFGNTELVIIGIEDRGLDLAKIIAQKIQQIDFNKKINIASININKPNPLEQEIIINGNIDLENKTIVLVDDVGNTGKTLFYALQPLIKYKINKLIVVVLIERMHNAFPVKADIVGFPMASTLNEMIYVKFENNQPEGAYLF